MNRIAIIQARMGSTRLPGKVMINIKGKTVLNHIVDRVRYCNNIDKIIVATSTDKRNDIIEKECKKMNIRCFRGSEEDVLERYYEAANQVCADLIVRITADCPMIDNNVIDKMMEKFLRVNRDKKIDYMSNFDVVRNTFPRGMDVEIISMDALKKSYKEAKQYYEREHVTPYIYNNIDKFNIIGYSNNQDLSEYRFTLDTKEDLNLIEIIYDNLYDNNKKFNMTDIVAFMNTNIKLTEINKGIEQKDINQKR